MNLFITADQIGTPSGGGVVTKNEKEAFVSLGETIWIDNTIIRANQADPFAFDLALRSKIEELQKQYKFHLAHFYAGTFSKTIELLKSLGTKISYTAAAHDLGLSISEHISILGHYPFKHMQDPEIFSRYIQGHKEADVVICPSNMSAKVMRGYGCKNVKVIPHGTEIPNTISPLPQKFIVGYLGAIGVDKGVLYLLKAWDSIGLHNSILNIAGRESLGLLQHIRGLEGGHFKIQGFVSSPSDFYNECSIYVQPSVTEGFGIEVLEAMAHGRPVIVSDGAGAADIVDNWRNGFIVNKKNPEEIAEKIKWFWKNKRIIQIMGRSAAEKAKQYSWEKIKALYCETWKNV